MRCFASVDWLGCEGCCWEPWGGYPALLLPFLPAPPPAGSQRTCICVVCQAKKIHKNHNEVVSTINRRNLAPCLSCIRQELD